MSWYYFICFLSLFISNVNLLSLRGSALTRYDPCGLGVIHFDKLNGGYWRGVIHFDLYSKLNVVETVILFDEPVTLYYPDKVTTFNARRTSWYDLIVSHVAPIPPKFIFNLKASDGGTPYVSKFILNNVTLCSEDIKTRHPMQAENVTKVFEENTKPHVCGRRFLNHTELVSVRTEAKAGEWPWHVAVFISNIGQHRDSPNFMNYECGGNIISTTTVLTAAHCIVKKGKIYDPNRVWMIAGSNNYRDITQVGRQVRMAKKLIVHPAYTEEFSTSDLAIIKVDDFIYNEYVQPICIWGPSYDKTELFGQEATIVGFGYTEENKQSSILRSSYTKVQSDETCIQFVPHVYTKLMNEFTLCAGYGPNSTVNPRNGDSGGGLVVSTLQPDHMISWFLRGVLSKCGVSPGHTACDPSYYVVYTDVGPHYGWIHHHSDLEFHINVP